jgi:hypothetical protein
MLVHPEYAKLLLPARAGALVHGVLGWYYRPTLPDLWLLRTERAGRSVNYYVWLRNRLEKVRLPAHPCGPSCDNKPRDTPARLRDAIRAGGVQANYAEPIKIPAANFGLGNQLPANNQYQRKIRVGPFMLKFQHSPT